MTISASTKQLDNAHSFKTSLSLIIHGGNNQICVDSRDIAKEFGRQHKNVLQTLDELLDEGIISRLESKPRNYIKLGREFRCFELNKAGFLKAMPFIGGRKSREGQRRFVDEFLKLELLLDRQSKEREKLAYHLARSSGKDCRAILKWSTKTGHFLKQTSCRIPVQIPTGIGSLMLNVFVYHYKTPNNQ